MKFEHEFDAKKKDLKVINDLNQVVKNLFEQYVISLDENLIMGVSGLSALNKGTHFSTYSGVEQIKNMLPEGLKYIRLVAGSVFGAIRDHKKELIGIEVVDRNIYFTRKDAEADSIVQIQIGDIIDRPLDDDWTYRTYFLAGKMKQIQMPEPSDLHVNLLMEREMVMLKEGDYKVRVTKEIIPNLTSKSEVSILFTDEFVSDPTLFNLIIRMEKTGVATYSIYTCLKY